ncbi:MAG TPA: hypothetical protein ENH97_00270 [bacterium]|nr:hypothetical protein [bacterium]
MMNKIIQYQDKVLKLLSGKMEEFYLAGGTALSRVYFNHRLSLDLDFFTQNFNPDAIRKIVANLEEALGKEIKLAGQTAGKGKIRMVVYYLAIDKENTLKMDFVEDWVKLIKPLKSVDGIDVLSKEDIYFRKILAIAGFIESLDGVGRKKFSGGREEAKDFYDLYFLSHTFMNLSVFARAYCDASHREGLIRWFRTYSRLDMKTGIMELRAQARPDYNQMERHFKKEIDKLIEKEIEF